MRKLKHGSLLGDSIRLDVFNIFNSANPTQRVFGDPVAWTMPRFFNLSITKDL